MKPRLEPVDHTADDALAWAQTNWRAGPRLGSVLFTRSLMQDRRDAEIMLAMRLYGWKRFALGQSIYFCLPDTLESWWYWDAAGQFEQLI